MYCLPKNVCLIFSRSTTWWVIDFLFIYLCLFAWLFVNLMGKKPHRLQKRGNLLRLPSQPFRRNSWLQTQEIPLGFRVPKRRHIRKIAKKFWKGQLNYSISFSFQTSKDEEESLHCGRLGVAYLFLWVLIFQFHLWFHGELYFQEIHQAWLPRPLNSM